MFSYDRNELAAFAVQRTLGQRSDGDDKTLAAVSRHLGRSIIGWLSAIVIVEAAVRYWGFQP